MILQALSGLYQRLVKQGAAGIAPYGYSPEKISYAIMLSPDGNVVDVLDIRDTSGKKPQPQILEVPQSEKRTVGIKSNFLWDKTSYVLGVSATSKRANEEHAAFKALHETAFAGTEDIGLQALLAFLKNWSPEQFQPPLFREEMKDTNMVFRLDGEYQYLHQREAAQTLRACLLAANNDEDSESSGVGMCLVSGESAVIARLHPSIKGVNGAQSSGAALVSFNLEAFTSYEKSQGDNAPVSESSAFAYTTALNYLLRRSASNRQRLQIGDATVVFWAEAETSAKAAKAEGFLASALNPPPDDASEAQRIRSVLEGIAEGRPLEELDPGLASSTRMYVLGLAPNASRLSIRFWLVDTLGDLARQLAWHREDLRLKPAPWQMEPSAWRLALATAPSRDGRAKAEDVPPQLAGELMRAILTGHRYPASLLANMVMRMRTDGDVSGVRVALCKAVLVRNLRISNSKDKEEIPVGLNKECKEPGYLLGRLFAVLESTQRAALGGAVNATIRDRYYGSASATPASIFPVLLRNTQNHLSKLRKEKPGLAVNLEKDIREIVDKLPENLPSSLKIESQGQFAIGYYHQSHFYFTKRTAEDGTPPSPENDPNPTEPPVQGDLL